MWSGLMTITNAQYAASELAELVFQLAEETTTALHLSFELVVHQGIPSVQVLALPQLALAYAHEIHQNILSAPAPVMWSLYI
jgi:hypothetical protein